MEKTPLKFAAVGIGIILLVTAVGAALLGSSLPQREHAAPGDETAVGAPPVKNTFLSKYLCPAGCTTEDFAGRLSDITNDIVASMLLGGIVAGLVLWEIRHARKSRRNTKKAQVSFSYVKYGRLYVLKLEEGLLDDMFATEHDLARVMQKAAAHHIRTADPDDPLVRFAPEDVDDIQRAIATRVKKAVGGVDPWRIGPDTEEMTARYWVAFTMENYGLARNEIPRIVVVPQWSFEALDPATVVVEKEHQRMRVRTHNAMFLEVRGSESDAGDGCFSVDVIVPET